MKNYEGIGYAVGALIGSIIAGICSYFGSTVLTIFACLIGAYLGGRIGKSIERPAK